MTIPTFIFQGFLDGGKTTFIKELLQDHDFIEGMRTLVVLCEEGITSYVPGKFASNDIFVECIENKEDFNHRNLSWLEKKHRAEQVLVEYNGMWDKDTLVTGIPVEWDIAQQATMIDSGTFLNYNKNFRQLVYEKLNTADLVVFNRCDSKELDKEAFHKIVRGANSRSTILYEYKDGRIEQDKIPDPPPYDMDADLIEIGDDAFAFFLRDMMEKPELYDGRKVKFKGRALTQQNRDMGFEYFGVGRHVMTCCIDDIAFQPMVCVYGAGCIVRLKSEQHGEWFYVTGKLEFKPSSFYSYDIGPVLTVSHITQCKPADPDIASF
ncbi:GTP-binding protein [Eubacteriales bacterium KG127]